MIIYEVNIEVEKQIEKNFYLWLLDHIKEVSLVGGFSSSKVYRVEDSGQKRIQFVVHYSIQNREKLEQYLKNHAPTLRQQAIELFGEKIKATRRILLLS